MSKPHRRPARSALLVGYVQAVLARRLRALREAIAGGSQESRQSNGTGP